jgi:hypothetical protein
VLHGRFYSPITTTIPKYLSQRPIGIGLGIDPWTTLTVYKTNASPSETAPPKHVSWLIVYRLVCQTIQSWRTMLGGLYVNEAPRIAHVESFKRPCRYITSIQNHHEYLNSTEFELPAYQ